MAAMAVDIDADFCYAARGRRETVSEFEAWV